MHRAVVIICLKFMKISMLDHGTSVSNLLKCHPERSYLIICSGLIFICIFKTSLVFRGNQKLHVRYLKKKKTDHYTCLGSCPPTPPLNQH